jgi:putative ubiquitin-RnfH superfamily antitoxin RatB of RatAB toxin-antitoxin module
MQHRSQLAAIGAEAAALGARAPVDAEATAIGVITNVARLDDDEILAVGGVRAVAIDRNLAADPAMIERKRAEMLGDQDDGIALAFVGTERPRRQHAIALKP